MATRRRSATIALILGPVIGAVCPVIQLAVECRTPVSEACVWGKALLPVSLAVSTVMIGAIAALVLFAVLEKRRRAMEKTQSESGLEE